MEPIQVRYHPKTAAMLKRFKKAAEQGGQYRVARRAHAVLLNRAGKTTGEMADLVAVSRSNVLVWLQNWLCFRVDGLFEGYRPGRPARRSIAQQQDLADIVDRGPIAYGFPSGVWIAAMIALGIAMEFKVIYHPGHVRKLLHSLGFSVQRPRRQRIKADVRQPRPWKYYTYPRIKSPVPAEGAALLFEDEASFRQDPTL